MSVVPDYLSFRPVCRHETVPLRRFPDNVHLECVPRSSCVGFVVSVDTCDAISMSGRASDATHTVSVKRVVVPPLYHACYPIPRKKTRVESIFLWDSHLRLAEMQREWNVRTVDFSQAVEYDIGISHKTHHVKVEELDGMTKAQL